MTNKVLIVVDMLNDFVKKDGALYIGKTADKVILNVKNRVNKYRKNNLPIIWLMDSHEVDDIEFKKFPPHCIKGTNGAKIIDELVNGLEINYKKSYANKTLNEFYLHKTRYDGFYGTCLSSILRALIKPEKVEVCGVCTSICCMDTVGSLANRDYTTIAHLNCMADFDQEAHTFAINRMRNLYGTIIL